MLGVGVSLRHLRGTTAVDAYKIGVYSPKLVFDFDEEYYRMIGAKTTFSDALTFSRSGSATYVDSTGTLQTAADGEPRTGHHVWNGSEWVNEGLLLESESRTNLITYSEDFTDADWLIQGGSVSAPDGDRFQIFTEDTGTSQHRIFDDGYTVSSGTSYTLHAELKYIDRQWAILSFFDTVTTVHAWFDLQNGVLGSATTGVTHRILEAGSGVYHCSLSYEASASGSTANIQVGTQSSNNNTTNWTADGSKIGIRNYQFEQGSTPSSYIPTSGSTVTRAGETLTVPAANLPWSPDAVSIQMEGTVTYADTGAFPELIFYRWLADVKNYIDSFIGTNTGTGTPRFRQAEASVLDQVIASLDAYSPGINVPFNIASRHGSAFINGAVDGTALTVNTTPTALPDLSNTDLDLGHSFMGTIKTFRVWNKDLGDDNLEVATS